MLRRVLLMGKIGYIRVSTEHQETARQEALMKQYQVERVFGDIEQVAVAMRVAGIVDHDVDPPERAHGDIDHFSHL